MHDQVTEVPVTRVEALRLYRICRDVAEHYDRMRAPQLAADAREAALMFDPVIQSTAGGTA